MQQRQDFAFETTLASRSFVPFLRKQQRVGYVVHVVYVWLPSPQIAIERVAARVERGGHHVRSDVVERRYWRGLANFMHLYRPLADSWIMCDNSGSEVIPVAFGEHERVTTLFDGERCEQMERAAARGNG